MSDIVLSASTRQNLLSLQNTAELLATTQNRLSTGKKVNTALDNPTNFFTAASLDARASDINNLLDGIGNGVQILQAANTGITSLQKLVDSAKSVANQALQTTIGYSPKSKITAAAVPGATPANLLGTPTYSSVAVNGTAVTAKNAAAITTATTLSGAAGTDSLPTDLTTGDTLTINNKTVTFVATGAASVDAGGNVTIGLDQTVGALLTSINGITGGSSSITGGAITLNTGTTSDLTIAGTALAKLGLTPGTTPRTATTPMGGETLTIAATGNGTATSITFGTGVNQVSNLNELNAALAPNNLIASIDTEGAITITTSNDAASSTIGAVGGSLAAVGKPFSGLVGSTPIADPVAQATRANLVNQYNNIMAQITTTSQDASFNGINLLGGDTLKLVFNETGKSTLTINGLMLDANGLGLANLKAGTDFIDNNSTNAIVDRLNAASSRLRAEASNLGSNLSVVQIRQDFSKNLINVLQTGSSNLTLADTNEEAANSQALATRQSIAVSALALANQSQQSVLQLLR